MVETSRRQPGTVRDYKERFEFKFTVGGNIICQRYFRINNFNPTSLASLELVDSIRDCAKMIDNDLKDKSNKYINLSAAQNFNSVDEMFDYFKDEKHKLNMRIGQGIVIKDAKAPNYVWGKNNCPVALTEKFDKDGEFTSPITSDDVVTYKFAFYDNGKEVCTTSWEGIYPRYIRNSIDLSNKKGKLSEGDDPSRLGYDSYILYKMVEGKEDIVYKIIKEICLTCSNPDNSWYTTELSFKKPNGEIVKYDNTQQQRDLEVEVKRMEAYLNGQGS